MALLYLVLGIVILAGAATFSDQVADALESRTVRIIQLAVGVGLMVLGVTVEPWTKAGKARKSAE